MANKAAKDVIMFQDLILRLQSFWAERGCVLQQPLEAHALIDSDEGQRRRPDQTVQRDVEQFRQAAMLQAMRDEIRA